MITDQQDAPPQSSDRVLEETTSRSFIEERIFDSEIKRLDYAILTVEKSIEKQDDKFTRAFEKLEATLEAKFANIDQRFEKVDQRFEKMEARFEKMMDKLDSNFKWLVGMYVPLTGVLLAAFYAFATYIR